MDGETRTKFINWAARTPSSQNQSWLIKESVTLLLLLLKQSYCFIKQLIRNYLIFQNLKDLVKNEKYKFIGYIITISLLAYTLLYWLKLVKTKVSKIVIKTQLSIFHILHHTPSKQLARHNPWVLSLITIKLFKLSTFVW